MKKILVPTDFSPCADNAVDFAVQSAKFIPAEVAIIHVFEQNGANYMPYAGLDMEFIQSKSDEADYRLNELKQNIEEHEKIMVDTSVYTNTVTKSILEATNDKNIDLIVMGTLGASGLRGKLWGSETGAIIGKTSVPVVVVPFGYKWKKPEKFLLVTSHFEKEPAILDFLFELADLFKAEVHVAVFTDEEEGAVNILEHGRKISEYEMMLREKYIEDRLTVTHLFGTEFEKTLQDYIKKNGIDLLAMVTHKRAFLDRIFHPSMTKRMSYHTKIPLLAIPSSSPLKEEF